MSKGDAEYERLEPLATFTETPTHVLKFEDGPLLSIFLDDEGRLVILVNGENDEDFKGEMYVTVDGAAMANYSEGEWS